MLDQVHGAGRVLAPTLNDKLVSLSFDLEGFEIHSFEILADASEDVRIKIGRLIGWCYASGSARHNASAECNARARRKRLL